MKQTILILGWFLAFSALARPIGIESENGGKDEVLSARGLRGTTRGGISRRAVMKPLSASIPGRTLQSAAVSRPAQRRPGRSSHTVNAEHSSNGASPTNLNGYAGGSPPGSVPRNGKIMPKQWPNAEASGMTKGPGFITMGNDDKLAADKRVNFKSNGPQDGVKVQGRIGASALAYSDTHGSETTASGYGTVAATLENKPGTTGCIECTSPGQKPLKYESKPGMDTFKVIAVNSNPDKGPLKIKATSYGPGLTSAAAYNAPTTPPPPKTDA